MTVYQRDTAWIQACDAMIAEVSTPSHGVGYEIAYAIGLGKPILCLYRQGARVSKMITGNTEPLLTVEAYEGKSGALGVVQRFLFTVQLR